MNLISAPKQLAPVDGSSDDFSVLKQQFDAQGFCLVRSLLDQAEVEEIRELFAGLNASARQSLEQSVTDSTDPLTLYPRILQPHRTNATARSYMLHPKVWTVLAALFGEEPVATQSMFYFKPPGARGQAMHQDQLYLMVSPGTCVAAWTAIDDCDAENGGMMVVPETGEERIVCPGLADMRESFTSHFVPVPKGKGKPQLVEMRAGDTLFFNGQAIHGSGPNRSRTRFRRAFIGHYAAGSTEKISKYYLPLVRRDGTDVEIAVNHAGGPCGNEWQGAAH